jgi:hypothetical protein
MTSSDLEILRSAKLFLELHGDDAVTKARDLVRTMRERDDNDGADAWLRIIVAIETIRQKTGGGVFQ